MADSSSGVGSVQVEHFAISRLQTTKIMLKGLRRPVPRQYNLYVNKDNNCNEIKISNMPKSVNQ